MYEPTYLYIYSKIVTNILIGFKSSWGSWSKISKLQQVGDFSFFWYKSSLLVSKVSFNYVYTLTNTGCFRAKVPIFYIQIPTPSMWAFLASLSISIISALDAFHFSVTFYKSNSVIEKEINDFEDDRLTFRKLTFVNIFSTLLIYWFDKKVHMGKIPKWTCLNVLSISMFMCL